MDEKIVKDSQGLAKELVNDTISRQAAIHAICRDGVRLESGGALMITISTAKQWAVDLLGELPSVQTERKRGKWHITDAYPHNVYCSECYTRFAQTHWAVWEDGSLPRNFCPNCGADMRGEADE